MRRQPFRAPEFVHPDFDAGEGRSGLRLTSAGALAMVDGNRSVRQSVLMLLTTRPGERVMRPNYGCELDQLVFSPNDDTTAGLAIHLVRRALRRWEPRVDIVKLDATRNEEDPSRLDILLYYRVRPTSHEEHLVIPLQLHPGI